MGSRPKRDSICSWIRQGPSSSGAMGPFTVMIFPVNEEAFPLLDWGKPKPGRDKLPNATLLCCINFLLFMGQDGQHFASGKLEEIYYNKSGITLKLILDHYSFGLPNGQEAFSAIQ